MVPPDTTVSYRVLAVARGSSGLEHAAFVGTGLIYRDKSGETSILGNTMTPIYRSHPELSLEVLVGSEHLRLQARGTDGTAVRWVAQIEIVEVRF